MKKQLLLLLIICCGIGKGLTQSVAINTDGSAADNSALLDVKSTLKGVLVPRMTTAERTAIATPATGLLVFDNEALGFWFYNGAAWVELGSGGGGGFWTANGTDVYNNNAGKVGIGTATPAQALTVQTPSGNYGFSHTDGTVTVSSYVGGSTGGGWLGTMSNHPLSIFTANGGAQVTFNTNSITDFLGTKPWLRFYDGGAQSGTIRSDGNNLEVSAYKPGTLIQNPGNLLFQIPVLSQFQSQYAGNVGIGTATPGDKLTVDAGSNSYGVTQTDGTITVGTWVGNGGGYFGTKSTHPLRFFTGDGGTQMTILTNGNVGIGTQTPTYRLSVNGNIRSKEVVVESGWADYVFQPDYRLRPLEEVERFITQNGHLPNVPSAKEIAGNGLSLGDTQKRMMEKIEELTLYVIALKKELQSLKSNGQK